MKKQFKKSSISHFTNFEVKNVSLIYGGNRNGSTIGGDLDIRTNRRGGVLNAAIGKDNRATTNIAS